LNDVGAGGRHYAIGGGRREQVETMRYEIRCCSTSNC
jgi:hypothetical protein